MDHIPKAFVKPSAYKNLNHSQTIFISPDNIMSSSQFQQKIQTLNIESPCTVL